MASGMVKVSGLGRLIEGIIVYSLFGKILSEIELLSDAVDK